MEVNGTQQGWKRKSKSRQNKEQNPRKMLLTLVSGRIDRHYWLKES